VQRRATNTGVVMVADQKIAVGRIHAGQVVTVHVAAEVVTIDLGEGTRISDPQPTLGGSDSATDSLCSPDR
jgi:hypothetical protein